MKHEPFDEQIERFRLYILSLLAPEDGSGQPLTTEQISLRESVSTLLEELQVASEELRQQSEELLQMHHVVIQEQRYQRLFEAAPDAYLVTTHLGIITQANSAAAQMLHIPQGMLVGKPLVTYLRGAELRTLLWHLRQMNISEPRVRQEWETQIYPRRQPPIDVHISAVVDEQVDGKSPTVLWLLHDVTEQKRLEREFFESQSRYRIIFEAARVGVALLDLNGKFIEANPDFQKIFGYGAEALDQLLYKDLISKGNPWDEASLFKELGEGNRENYAIEQSMQRQDGKRIWVAIQQALMRDEEGRPHYILGLFEDVTAARQRDEEILSMERNLEEVRNVERESLARDLHDGPLQSQIGLLFRLQQFDYMLNDVKQMREMQEIRQEAQEVVRMLRTSSGLLRSPILAHFGLERAIQGFVDQILASGTDLRMIAEIETQDWNLPPRVEQGIYRIYLHVMTNVIRHAKASYVLVQLHKEDNHLVLGIEDDGVGFPVPERWADLMQAGHYGLMGSAERAAALGGELHIRSQPGLGTSVRVTIPLNEADQQKHSLDDLGPEIATY